MMTLDEIREKRKAREAEQERLWQRRARYPDRFTAGKQYPQKRRPSESAICEPQNATQERVRTVVIGAIRVKTRRI